MHVGVDIGTQSLKVVVIDGAFMPKGTARRNYPASFPQPGWAEQDSGLWERALGPAIAEALAAADVVPEDVRGLGICGQLDGCIAVDDAGRALGPCLLWMDRRATDETADIPSDLIRRKTGIIVDAGHMAAKVRWLKRNRLRDHAARFHQPVSYVVKRLTGAFVIDHALASTTMVCALDEPRYDPALLNLFGIDAAELPRIDHAAALAGRLHESGAALTGLPRGLPVAVGTGDDFSTSIGAGLLAPGRVSVGLGTGEVVGALHRSPLIDDAGLVETHPYPGLGSDRCFFIENPGWLGGGSVVWLMSILGLSHPRQFDDLAALAPPGADGATFLPCLSGAMAPRWRSAARGSFYGLTTAHGREHMARAVLEGTAFAMRDVIDRLDSMGVATDTILMLGGGARSALWGQIRADVAGRNVDVPRITDTCPIGAAMLAAVASGDVSTLADAAALIEGGSETITPNPRRASAYDSAYAAYRRLFDTLEPMFT